MELGLGTYAYAWAIGVSGYPVAKPMDAFAFLRRADELGVRRVQIADNIPLDQLPEDRIEKLRAEATARSMAVEVGTRGIAPDILYRYLQLARHFGSPIVRTVIDRGDHRPGVDETIAILRGILPEYEVAGVTLAIENHDRFKTGQFIQILEGTGSARVGICLDTVNSFGALEGPEIVVERLGPYVVNLHVKEFTIRRAEHNMGFVIEGRPAGKGCLDVPWLLGEVRRHNADANAILELWPPPESVVEETIRKEDAWVVESIGYLRSFLLAK